ncbi:3-ketodihydrosphingosine reductase-like protein, partial [Tanacetum coccineum]
MTTNDDEGTWCIPWTPEEEIALCKGWVLISEDSVLGNTRKEKGLWTSYRLVYDNVTRGAHSGAGDRDYTLKALEEYRVIYGVPFTLFHHSFNTTQSGYGSFNLNDITGDKKEDEVHLCRPMGMDITEKKASTSCIPSASSTAGNDKALVTKRCNTNNTKGIAAIVGVGPNLGRSIARKFAHEGYTVAILARDLGRLSRFADEIA